MNFTLTGILLVIVFVLPGAAWAGFYYGEFQTKKHSSTELILESLTVSLVIHFFFLLFLCLIYSKVLSEDSQALFRDYLQKDLHQAGQLRLIDLVQVLVASMAYVLAAICLALGSASVSCSISRSRKAALTKKTVVFQNLFDDSRVNYVKITMTDGMIAVGQIKHYPQDYDSVRAESKEIILANVDIIENERQTTLNDYCDAGQEVTLYVTTSNIKTLQVMRHK